MKPDWKDAPEWAKYLAMDEDGEWYWYEAEPLRDYAKWKLIGRYESAGDTPSKWVSSLEQRPPNDEKG